MMSAVGLLDLHGPAPPGLDHHEGRHHDEASLLLVVHGNDEMRQRRLGAGGAARAVPMLVSS